MYFQSKVEGYNGQGRKAAKETDSEEHVDVASCQRCNKNCFTIRNGSLCSDFTCQRLDNGIGHFKSNCISYCAACNRISR